MKLSTIKRMITLSLVNHVFAGTRFFGIKRALLNQVGYQIGEGTKIVAPITNTGTLCIGKDCWIGRDLTIHGNGTVTIGDCCDVAPGVTFLTGGHQIGTHVRRAGAGETYSIHVGSGTWIGARSTILGNVTLGDGCVVASMACVTRNIPADTVVGGVPAKPIRSLENESKIILEG
ncbi:MAG: hypothetical protein LUH09_04670 [Clostridiales bacterium]|nr:hypothetical protein [Clostridiales bacterium]